MKYVFLTSAAAVFALQSGTAQAQDAADAGAPEVVGNDIIVTANRVESLLSKTPIAITAIGGEELVKSGITNPTQLEESVPNLSIVRGNGLQITIRGVTSTDGTEKGDPSAAFMLDGVYLARPQAQEVSFFDIERIEVLRGPQGTLYGRNSTAGVVNLISARPKFELGGSFDVSYANYDHLNATAVVNLPVSDTLAIRAAGNIDRRDNFLIDAVPGDGVSIDPFKDNQSVRLSALFEPTADISLLLIGDYSTQDGNPTNGVDGTNFFNPIPQGVRPTFERPTYLDPTSREGRTLDIPQSQQAYRDNDGFGLMGELNWNFGPATFTYLSSYREMDREEFLNIRNGLVSADFFGDYWQTSQEARLAFGEGPLQAQVGAYYFKEKSGIAFFINNLLGPNTRFGFPQDPTIAQNKSAFGQLTYEIAPNLRLTGGLRYSHDLKSRVGNTVLDIYDSIGNSYSVGNFIVRNTFQNNDASRNFSKITWRAGVDYDTDVGLLFASVSTGYKAGGFNDGCEIGTGPGCALPAEALYYNPETLTAYEAGAKLRFGPSIAVNATVFHYDYNGLQLSQVAELCGGPCQVTTNAGSSKVDGIELDTFIQPVEGLTLRAAFNYLDARYTEFEPQPGIDFAGRGLNRSPETTWSAGINYAIPIGDAELVADAGIRGSSSYELTDLANFAYFYQPSFTKTDMSLTYNGADDAFYLGVYVENLENELVLTGVGAGAFPNASFADPRTYGVRAGMRF